MRNLFSMDGSGFAALILFLSLTTFPAQAFEPRPDVTVCADGTTVSGLDVSDFDPNTDWPTVQSTGRVFVFVKATEGNTFRNQDFASDWKAAKNAGFIRSPYHFFHPSDDPVKQAKWFLSTVGKLNSNDLPAMLDWEITGGESSSVQVSRALLWLAQVEAATGKTPIIYVAPKFWEALGDRVSDFAHYPLFVANYDVSCPDIPAPWTDWTFWQQGLGPIDGVHANFADLDIFNGSIDQLHTFAQRFSNGESISKSAPGLNI